MARPYRQLIRAAGAAALVLCALSTHAETARELAWDDLLAKSDATSRERAAALQQKLSTLSDQEREQYQRVARELIVREKLASGIPAEDLRTDERQALADKPSEAYPDAAAFWTEVKKTREELQAASSQVDPEMAGQRVRIPGYVLPLEFDGTKVSEFLLVPFVGACIHTPPPPPNQMVFVKSAEDFESEGLYSPVWVEGTLSTQGGTHDLSFVDGQAPVEAGYSMQRAKVEPYSE